MKENRIPYARTIETGCFRSDFNGCVNRLVWFADVLLTVGNFTKKGINFKNISGEQRVLCDARFQNS